MRYLAPLLGMFALPAPKWPRTAMVLVALVIPSEVEESLDWLSAGEGLELRE